MHVHGIARCGRRFLDSLCKWNRSRARSGPPAGFRLTHLHPRHPCLWRTPTRGGFSRGGRVRRHRTRAYRCRRRPAQRNSSAGAEPSREHVQSPRPLSPSQHARHRPSSARPYPWRRGRRPWWATVANPATQNRTRGGRRFSSRQPHAQATRIPPTGAVGSCRSCCMNQGKLGNGREGKREQPHGQGA